MTVTNGASARSAPPSELGTVEPGTAGPLAGEHVDHVNGHGVGHRLRRFFHRFAANEDTHDAERLQKDVAAIGATPIKRCTAGSKTCVVGTIRSITLQPVTGTPALHADLWDGSGSIRLIWLGRRQIPGIDPGRELMVEGRVIEEHGHPTMYNPRYELRSGQDAAAH
jgi:hypothetical protein